jgi:hypothetical protein
LASQAMWRKQYLTISTRGNKHLWNERSKHSVQGKWRTSDLIQNSVVFDRQKHKKRDLELRASLWLITNSS